MKLIKLILLLLLNLTILSGCWNYRDIERYSLVAGFAIDRDVKDNKYIITAEVVDFSMSGKEAKAISQVIQSKGDTIFDGIRNMLKVTGKRLYWGHAKIVVISKDISEDGISPALDLIHRDPELREQIHVLISKENNAKMLLEQETMTADLHAFEIEKMLESQESLGKIPKIQVYELINAIESNGISPALPVAGIVENEGKKTVELMGTAIFKVDKLVGFLNEEESKVFLFVTNKINKGLLIENTVNNKPAHVTLEVFNNSTKIKPTYSYGNLTMNIDILIDAAIAEIGSSQNYITEKGRNELKLYAEESLRSSAVNLIKKVQENYDTDIFGFGQIIMADKPSLWKDIEPDWDNIYRKLDVNVNVDINIRNSALDSNTIRKED